MFVLSKLFIFLTDPGTVVLAALTAGAALLWTRWQRAGRGIVSVTTLAVLVLAVFPVGELMTAALENRFPAVRKVPRPVAGIITLGGTMNQFITMERDQPALTGGAERLTEFVALARRHPEARLVYTGGSGSLTRQEVKEADAARMFFRRIGLDPARVVFERRSRNTLENAVFTYRMMAPKRGERWVLITSAMHMPRSVGVFRKAGWSPLPYPVDFTTEWPPDFSLRWNMVGGMSSFGGALREWMGLVAYRLLGRTDALFPAPERRRTP